MSDLSPEQLEVLRLIQKDGIEATLTDKQWDIREDLESKGFIYLIGDEYDSDLHLSLKGTLALEQVDNG